MRAPFGMTRDYYLLLGSYFISTAGDWLYQLALPLLVYELTSSALSMAITYALTYLPLALLLPFGGVIADRVDRRRLLVLGDLGSALVVGVLAILVWQGFQHVWVIYATAFVLAAIAPFYHPAHQSLIPSLLDEHQLPRGNSWLNGGENTIALLGPLVGGVAIAALGTTTALFLDAGTFLLSALLILGIRRSRATTDEPAEAQSWLRDVREGFAFVWSHPIIRWGALLFFGANFASALFQANYVYILTATLEVTPSELGLAFAIPGLGAILGALIAPTVARRFGDGLAILGGTIASGIALLPVLAAHDVFTIAIPWAVVAALDSITAVTWFTMRQRVVPAHLLGRVVALTRLIAFIPIPIGAVVGGALLSTTQSVLLLVGIAATVCFVVGIMGLATPLARRVEVAYSHPTR